MTNDSRKDFLLKYVTKFQPCSAFDIMREYESEHEFEDAVARHRFVQSVHAGLHDLWEDGAIDRPEHLMKIEKDSGVEVFAYTIAAPGTSPRVKQGVKRYKEKYEQSLERIKELEEQVEFLIMMNDKYKDQLASQK